MGNIGTNTPNHIKKTALIQHFYPNIQRVPPPQAEILNAPQRKGGIHVNILFFTYRITCIISYI